MVINPLEVNPGDPPQAIMQHVESGLRFGMVNFQYGFLGFEILVDVKSIEVDTRSFIRCTSAGEPYDFYVENFATLTKLHELTKDLFMADPQLVVDPEYFNYLQQAAKEDQTWRSL